MKKFLSTSWFPYKRSQIFIKVYRKTLEKLFKKVYYSRRDETQRTRKELERLETRKSNLQNDLMDRTIKAQVYQDMKGKENKDLPLIRDKLTDLQQQT